MSKKDVQSSMNRALSGLKENPFLAQRVIAEAAEKEGKIVKKKLSVSLILVIVLLAVLCMTALAAGLGLFGRLSGLFEWADTRLPQIDEAAEEVGASVTTEEGITVTVEQAYYENNRVFVSYRLSGPYHTAEYHEGAPEGEQSWEEELPDTLMKDYYSPMGEEGRKMAGFLDGKSQRWVSKRDYFLHDGIFLDSGEYLDIIGGDFTVDEDGSQIGWKECEIPEDLVQDTLNFKLVLISGTTLSFQDGTTFRTRGERLPGETDIPFTLTRNTDFIRYSGSFSNDVYRAEASFELGKIDLKGQIHVFGPAAWQQALVDWESTEDSIWSWNAAVNGEPAEIIDESNWPGETEGECVFELVLTGIRPGDVLTLFPSYSASDEHPGEAMTLTAE